MPSMLDELSTDRLGLRFDETAKLVEVLPKFAMAFLAVTYVAGFAIINLHLRRYGLFSAGLIQGEYVLAGTTWLVFLAIAFAAVVSLWDDFQQARTHAKSRRWVFATLRIVFGLFYMFYLPFLAMTTLGVPFDWTDSRFWVAEVVILFTPVGLFALRHVAFRAWQEWRAAGGRVGHRTRWELFQVFALLLVLLSMYASAVFPWIPPVLGGGRPTPVLVVATRDAADTKVLLKAALGPGPAYALITETHDWLVLGEAQGPPSETPWAPKRAVRVRPSDVRIIVSGRGIALSDRGR